MENLVRVSTYAKSINKSVELVRTWIRSGKWVKGEHYIVIDDVTFVVLDNVNQFQKERRVR